MNIVEEAKFLFGYRGYDESGIMSAEEWVNREDDVHWICPRNRGKREAGIDVQVCDKLRQVFFENLKVACIFMSLLFCRLITFVKSSQHWSYSRQYNNIDDLEFCYRVE